MTNPVKLIGSPVSPFVRKALAILDLKTIDFENDPVVAFYTDERFTALNPLRRIPVLIDGETVIADSSVIAHYLDEKYPSPAILPASPQDRARVRWLDNFAATRMADIFLWRCFNAVVIRPSVWGEARDMEAYRATLAGPVANIMDYLETLAPASGSFCGDIGLADISVAVMFRNMRYARWAPDAERWPKTAAWIERIEVHPAMRRGISWADTLVATPIPEQRAKAAEIGLPLTRETFFASTAPRRGPMTV
jgi:glutathione S-transferase